MWIWARIFLAALTLMSAPLAAQTATSVSLPQSCVTAKQISPVLEAQRQTLQRELLIKTASLTSMREKIGNDAPQFISRAKEIEETLQQFLNVALQIECIDPDAAIEQAIEFSIYYATNRLRSEALTAEDMYGSGVSNQLQFGKAAVSIPLTLASAMAGIPNSWTAKQEVQFRGPVLRSLTPVSDADARSELAAKAKSDGPLLIFVHGFKMSFAEAALRAAQLAHDLRFEGTVLLYSWPSANRLSAYFSDEESVRFAESIFGTLIDDLVMSLPFRDIYIVAHGMGTRVVSHALQHRAEMGKRNVQLRELFLVAPDINAELFRGVIAPKLATMQGLRTTVYASSSDLALMASKVVHGFQRVGETLGGVFTYPGIEVFDASSATFVRRSYGHSYLTDAREVIADIRRVITRPTWRKSTPAGAPG
jgi:esterase/lipase superfamily enzyme